MKIDNKRRIILPMLSFFLFLFSLTFISAWNFEFGGSTSTTVNNFTINGTSAIHNDLTGLQGGNTSERYHLNLTDWNSIKVNQFLWVTSAGAGDISSIFTLNNFIALNNTLSGDIYLNFNGTYLNFTTDSRYFTKAQWNVTNSTYRTRDNLTFIGNISATTDVCIEGGNCLSVSATGDNSSWNQSYAKTINDLLYTSFAYVDNKRNLTNFTFTGAGNFTGDVYSNSVNNLTVAFLHNSSGWIRDWNISGWIRNQTLAETNWNSSGLIRNWNISGDIQNWNSTGYIRDWSGTGDNSSWNQSYSKTINDLLYAVLGSGNTSLQMFQAVDNGTFLKISQFNVTNSSYRTLVNGTFPPNVNITITNVTAVDNITATFFLGFINASNVLNAPWTSGVADNSSWNQSYSKTINDLLYAVLGSGNTSLQMFQAVDNGTFLKISQFNVTNTSYVVKNVNWNDTNFLIPQLNNTYDLGNSTNIFGKIWVGTLNIITKITTSQISNSAITSALIQAGVINSTHIGYLSVNNSHIQAGAINVTQIGVSGVNTTTILDNTILPIDLHLDINLTYVRNNTAFNTTLINVTRQYITQQAGNCPTTISGSICRNTTGTFIVG